MKRKLFVVGVGAAIGYLLGSHAGRERYDAVTARVISLWEEPRVARTRADVEAYARQQAPLIRKRAEAAAKAAPGVAKDVAEKVVDTAKDVADRVTDAAKDVADKTTATARDVADKTTITAKDVADKTSTTAKDVAERVSEVATDVRGQAGKVATDLRERGEAAVDNAVASAGEVRENALETIDDEDDPRS